MATYTNWINGREFRERGPKECCGRAVILSVSALEGELPEILLGLEDVTAHESGKLARQILGKRYRVILERIEDGEERNPRYCFETSNGR